MFQSATFGAEGTTPSGSYTTTYRDDFKPINERQPQLKPRTNAKPLQTHISPPQANGETWSVCFQHLHKTTNGTYGSTVHSQSPFSSLVPAVLSSMGIPTHSFSGTVGNVGCTLKDERTQEARVSREKMLSFAKRDDANRLREQELKDKPQWKTDVHYEEGETVLSPCTGLTCCNDFLKSLHGEVRSFNPPVAPTSLITLIYSKDGNGVNSTHLWNLSPAVGMQSSSVLQPPSRQCSHCTQETECPVHCCYEIQITPHHKCQSSTQPTSCCTGSNTKLPLTEYQANYYAEWAIPKIQQIYHCICPCHRNLQPLL